jgi:glucan phosphoethanolaminetransferase (alkaline phosphatase superfamily)
MGNILLTFITFITTIAGELLFLISQNQEILIPSDKYISLFIFLLVFSCIRQKQLRFISMNMVVILSFFQMMHLQFFGIPVYPNAIFLFFAESNEVFGTVFQDFSLFFIPCVFSLIPLVINSVAFRKIQKLKTVPYLHFLFLFYLIYNPVRTFVTGNTWGRQPSTQEFLGMNVYLSTSYFLGKILPAKLSSTKVHEKSIIKLTPDFKNTFKGNIIFVLGESQTANHLSLFGYKRKTTPYLDSMKNDKNFVFKRAISGGVSTDVSVAFLLNNTFGKYGIADIVSGKHCLFNLAKKSGFKTRFYSSQSQQQLRYVTNSICPKFIDDYKNLDHIEPEIENENAADDLKLLEHLFKTDLNESTLTILHQRGGHLPYNLRYPKSQTTFQLIGDYKKDQVNHYDNAVIQLDIFMSRLISQVKKSKTPTIILYVSDHGEGLGEEGVWGHASLKRPSFEVPLLVYGHKADSVIKRVKKLNENPTHLDISLFISRLLGFKNNMSGKPYSYTIYGNDLDGFAGYLETTFKDGKLINILKK